MKRAVFLDRDGTLIVEKEYLRDPEQVEFYPGVPEALARLRDAGFLLVMVTNQSGVGRGYFTMADVDRVHERIADLLAARGIRFEAVYVAPEAPDQPSRGRKPSPEFLFDARDQFGIDLPSSYMVGDKEADVECGRRARVRASVLVRTGYGGRTERENPESGRGVMVVDDLPAAVDWILGGGAVL